MSNNDKSTPFYKRKIFILPAVVIGIGASMTVLNAVMNTGDEASSVSIADATQVKSQIASPAGTGEASEKYNEQVVEFSKKSAEQAIANDGTYVQQVTNEPLAPSFAEKNNAIADNNASISIASLTAPKNEKEVIIKKEIVVDNTQLEQLKLELEKSKQMLLAEQENTKQLLIQQEMARQDAINTQNNERIARETENIEKVFTTYLENYRKTAPGKPSIKVFASYEPEQKATDAMPDKDAKTDTPSNKDKKAESFVKPGDMLYAKNKIAINTDYSAQNVVIAEIISNDKKTNGAKAFGSFQMKKDSLVLQFNRIQLNDGTSVAIDGYAINENDYIATVRSDYDNHYIERYGLFFAGAFVKGLADAVTQKAGQNSTVVYDANGNPVGNTSGNYELTAQDSMIIAGGEVATQAADILKQNMNRAPTVTLNYGQTFGIVIMDVKK
jgi:hypothetical protein